MNLTIKDVLQLFQGESMHLTAGSTGMENAITSVNIMDAPDIWNWVKPGDLILTTAFTIKDDPALQERLIRELSAAKCAGLGIKVKRFLPEIPESMKKVANDLKFPLLELPLNLSLAEIMNPIMSSIAARQSYLLQRTNEIHKTLTSVAIKGGGLNPIVTCLGKLTQCPVGCYDINGLPLNYWVPDSVPGISPENLKRVEQFLANKILQNDSLQQQLSHIKSPYTQPLVMGGHEFHLTSFAIMSSNEFFGHISILQPSDAFSDINCVALEHTCTVAALDFLKQKAVAESRRLHSRDILEHILFGDLENQTTAEIIATSNLTQAKYFKCSIIELDDTDSEVNIPVIATRLYKTMQQMVSAKYPLSLISERAGKIIALVATTSPLDGKDTEVYPKLRKTFSETLSKINLSVGIGTPATDVNTIRQSYHDALTCLNLGRMIKGTGHTTYPHEIASYSILTSPDVSSILNQVCGTIIARLESADKTMGTDLLKTLEKYLECDKNLTETAKELYIHRNTLANRLDRIVDIGGVDLKNRELLFCLRLALRQRRIIHTAP